MGDGPSRRPLVLAQHETTFPPTPSSSEVIQDIQDPERDIQRYIDGIDYVRLYRASRFSKLKGITASRESHPPRSGTAKIIQ